MALHSIKEITGNAALRLSPPNIPSSPSRRGSASTAAPKSKILAMLDADLSSLTRSEAPLAPSIAKSKSAPVHHNVFVAGTAGSSASVALAAGYFTDNRAFGDPWPPSNVSVDPRATTRPAQNTSEQRTKPVSKNAKTTEGTTRTRRAHAVAQDTEAMEVDASPSYTYRDYSPKPALVYTCHEDEANDLVQSLQGPLGFDLEWKVQFRKGPGGTIERRTAVVQLSDEKMILVIQISGMQKFPPKLKELIESPQIVKTGANIANDGRKLFRDFGILAANLVELGGLGRQADPAFAQKRNIVALATIVQTYTGKALNKGPVRSSDWEHAPLTPEQLEYAANDAHCAITVYNKLMKMAVSSGRVLEPEKFTTNLQHDYTTGKLNVKTTPTPPALSRESTASSIDSQSSGATASSNQQGGAYRPSPQHRRAYDMWHHRKMTMDQIRAALRSKDNPLAVSTVITYVVWALQADATLPFSMPRLKEFVQLEAGSWRRHRDWIITKDLEQRSSMMVA
ncbi:hypothetical protein EIP91_006284 [Steccherinum ochraceum]|uniref:3'-5' exonuclease domain-containing protein n=1 Tax=Steccherinum ochraceum TaxID=92696 RepID=A0A4R0RZ64_9APHY|nr:hypothetical protein EIP91_006284 [Steccherinum ochraceum]